MAPSSASVLPSVGAIRPAADTAIPMEVAIAVAVAVGLAVAVVIFLVGRTRRA